MHQWQCLYNARSLFINWSGFFVIGYNIDKKYKVGIILYVIVLLFICKENLQIESGVLYMSDKEFLILLSYLPYAKVRLESNVISKQLGNIDSEGEQQILFYKNMVNKFDIAINTLTTYEKKSCF